MKNLSQDFLKTNFDSLLPVLKETLISKKKAEDRRIFLWELSLKWWRWWQSKLSKSLKVWRKTIRKWEKEVKSWILCIWWKARVWAKGIEEKLPNILKDLKEILDNSSQTDPTFKTTRVYTRLTPKVLRKELIKQKWYTNEELPVAKTLYNKSIKLWYNFTRVSKTKPLKRIKETDDIFDKLNEEHEKSKKKHSENFSRCKK